MEEIKNKIGQYFGIHGTKEQLLEVEKELERLGYKNGNFETRWNNEHKHHGDYNHIICYESMAFMYHNHSGHPDNVINLINL